jgi:hypothetical protein
VATEVSEASAAARRARPGYAAKRAATNGLRRQFSGATITTGPSSPVLLLPLCLWRFAMSSASRSAAR